MYNKKKQPCTKPFFTASTGRRCRGCIPHALVTETRKSGNGKVTRGGDSGFIENRTIDGTDESFLTRLLPFALPLYLLCHHRVLRTLSWRQSSHRSETREWPFTFFLCRPRALFRVTRMLFKSRINRERKLAWMQPIDTTIHRGGNRLVEGVDSDLTLCATVSASSCV